MPRQVPGAAEPSRVADGQQTGEQRDRAAVRDDGGRRDPLPAVEPRQAGEHERGGGGPDDRRRRRSGRAPQSCSAPPATTPRARPSTSTRGSSSTKYSAEPPRYWSRPPMTARPPARSASGRRHDQRHEEQRRAPTGHAAASATMHVIGDIRPPTGPLPHEDSDRRRPRAHSPFPAATACDSAGGPDAPTVLPCSTRPPSTASRRCGPRAPRPTPPRSSCGPAPRTRRCAPQASPTSSSTS